MFFHRTFLVRLIKNDIFDSQNIPSFSTSRPDSNRVTHSITILLL
ncbi:hypothetical protein HMPREF9996_00879 [Aggregatibacter actinomycetemcomitans Y4]|nr:hypothetical protein HMPREF9996_00879 [Aggregatibacter actinomycetemcomitans Y4]